MTSPALTVDLEAIQRVKQALDGLAEKQYTGTMNDVLSSIGSSWQTGRLGKSFGDLRNKSFELQAGNDLRRTAEYKQFVRDLDRFLAANTVLIDQQSEKLYTQAVQDAWAQVQALSIGNTVRGVRPQWNRVDPETLNQIAQYTRMDEWDESLSKYGGYVRGAVDKAVLANFVTGKNPRQSVNDIALLLGGSGDNPAITVSQAESLTRTLYHTARRDAVAIQQKANDHIIDHVIRIAALDHRTCLTCIELHGSRLEPGERVDDHRRGRCDSISILKSNPRSIETGAEWFEKQPEQFKQLSMGQAKYNAYKAGKVQLKDFVKTGTDPIFGKIVQENSLKGVLGAKEAKKYYWHNQPKPAKKPLKQPKSAQPKPVVRPPKPKPKAQTMSEKLGLIPRDVVRNVKGRELDTKEYRDWANKLPKEQADGIRFWSRNGYGPLRAIDKNEDTYGRFNRRVRESDREQHPFFVKGMKSGGSITDIFWRGIKEEGSIEDTFEKHQRTVGTIIEWREHNSTSVSSSVGLNFSRGSTTRVVFEIYSAKPKPMKVLSAYPSEEEAIMPPGQKFRVLDVFNGTFKQGSFQTPAIIVQIEDVD